MQPRPIIMGSERSDAGLPAAMREAATHWVMGLSDDAVMMLARRTL